MCIYYNDRFFTILGNWIFQSVNIPKALIKVILRIYR